ncbi:MAG TPA: hypothetical protein PKC43_06175 [Phycisphaerales bacterium]|nr:hypothetical protein [Phycisphaerales bacterium]HMP37018.1 hypothetical protein [Phycisphaerales bacterium]
MRSFTVMGASRDTGKPVKVTIEAETLLEAQEQAADMGIMVSDIREPTAPTGIVEVPREGIAARQGPSGHGQAYPPGQPSHVNQVVVHAGSGGSSSMGIASVILGLVALLICWIPFVSIIGAIFAGLGLLLAIIGVLAAVFRRGRGIGFALGGGALCVVSLSISLVTSVGLAAAVSGVPSALEQARSRAHEASVQGPAASSGPTVVDWQAWADVDDVRIRLVDAYVGTRNFDQFGRAMTTTSDAVWIKMEIENPSTNKRAPFVSWRDRGLFGRADVVDEHGNRYTVYTLTGGVPDGGISAESIYPGQTVADWFACELPVDAATELRVRPLRNGNPIGIEFRVPDHALAAR